MFSKVDFWSMGVKKMQKKIIFLLAIFIVAFIFCGVLSAATGNNNQINTNKISNVGVGSVTSVGNYYLIEKSKIEQVSSKSLVSALAPTLGQALDNTKLTWTTTPTGQWYYHPWNGNTIKSHDGVDAAEASSLNYGGSTVLSKLQTTVYGPGTIKFYWMKYYYVSSQDFTYVNAYGSCLFFFNDNNKSIFSMDKFSENSAWSQKSYTMGPGTHVLTWNTVLNCPANSIFTNFAYKHWNSLSAYVDQVQWIPAPKVSSTSPNNLKTGVARTSTIVIKFNEKIKKGTEFNKISINKLNSYSPVSTTKTISGSTLKIKHSKLASKTWYKVTISQAAIRDYAGNNLKAKYTFKFKTGG
jgi:hypothetical protein